MKECFTITTYCDTEEKIEILKSTIENLKQFNVDIIIHAHYPLNKDIQNSVNHYINSENFIIDNKLKVSWSWIIYDNYKMYNYQTNYNYSVLKQFNESISYLFPHYDVIHFLNYDSNITQELYDNSKKYCGDKSTFYQNFFIKGKYVTAMWFSLNRKDKDFFMNITSYNEYAKSKNYAIEKYIGEQVDKIDIKFVELENYDSKSLYENEKSFYGYDYTTEQVYEQKLLPSLNFKLFFEKDNYYIFGGYFNKNFALIFYNIKKKLNIEIKVKDNTYNLIINNDTFLDTNIKIDDLNCEEINIKVNDHIIDDILIDRFLKNKIDLINNDKW